MHFFIKKRLFLAIIIQHTVEMLDEQYILFDVIGHQSQMIESYVIIPILESCGIKLDCLCKAT